MIIRLIILSTIGIWELSYAMPSSLWHKKKQRKKSTALLFKKGGFVICQPDWDMEIIIRNTFKSGALRWRTESTAAPLFKGRFVYRCLAVWTLLQMQNPKSVAWNKKDTTISLQRVCIDSSGFGDAVCLILCLQIVLGFWWRTEKHWINHSSCTEKQPMQK